MKKQQQQPNSPISSSSKKSLSRLSSLENKSESSSVTSNRKTPIKGSGSGGGGGALENCYGIGDRAKEIGKWVELVQRRSLRLADLRREFQGWHGNHERHCILHDVLLTP